MGGGCRKGLAGLLRKDSPGGRKRVGSYRMAWKGLVRSGFVITARGGELTMPTRLFEIATAESWDTVPGIQVTKAVEAFGRLGIDVSTTMASFGLPTDAANDTPCRSDSPPRGSTTC